MSETCPVIRTATPMEHMLDWKSGRPLEITIKTSVGKLEKKK
jgi:hypothetical protein